MVKNTTMMGKSWLAAIVGLVAVVVGGGSAACAASAADTWVYDTSGDFVIAANEAGEKYLYYTNGNVGQAANITIGDGSETYAFAPTTTNGRAIIMVDANDEVTISGNVKYVRALSKSNLTYGIDAYDHAKATLNGNFTTSLNAVGEGGNNQFNYGVLSEAGSQVNLDSLTVKQVQSTSEYGLALAIGVAAITMDGNYGQQHDGSSTVNITGDTASEIKNIVAKSDSGEATAVAVIADGQTYDTSTFAESSVNINTPLVIDTVTAESTSGNATANALNSQILGVINVNNDLEIKNISSSANNAYALEATWGGKINVNASGTSTVKITGDVDAHSCLSDASDVAEVNLKLTNADSYLDGSIMQTGDDGEEKDVFGDVSLTLSNGAAWLVKNSSNPDFPGSNDLTSLTLDSGIIDMSDPEDQKVNVENIENANGTVVMNFGDTFNVEQASGSNNLQIKFSGTYADLLAAIQDKTVVATVSTTAAGSVTYSFANLTDGDNEYVIQAEVSTDEATGLATWTLVSAEEVDNDTGGDDDGLSAGSTQADDVPMVPDTGFFFGAASQAAGNILAGSAVVLVVALLGVVVWSTGKKRSR